MAADATSEALRELAAFRAAKGCAVSLYLDLDPSVSPTAADIATRTNSLLATARRTGDGDDGLSHEQREALKADFDRIGGFFRDFDRDGVHGLAIFASGLDGIWRTLSLPGSVPDGVQIGGDFRLAPLVPLLRGVEGTLVVQVSREQGRVYRIQHGQLREVADHTEEQPGQHDQGGWSQARYQRHLDKLVQEHLKTIADDLDKRSRRGRAPRIVLVCPEELKAGFLETVSSEVRDAVIGSATAEAHAGPIQLLEAVTPVLEHALAEEEAELVDRWREEAGKGGRAASGWEETLDAASDARVEALLVQEGAGRPAFACPECGRASARAGDCPLDGTAIEPREEGLDLAVRHTLANGGTIVPVRHRRDLDPVEGIGALLRF